MAEALDLGDAEGFDEALTEADGEATLAEADADGLGSKVAIGEGDVEGTTTTSGEGVG